MTRVHAFLAQRFGVRLEDLLEVDRHTAVTFTKVSEGGAYGYRWRSPRWRCDVCSRSGLGTDDHPYLWSEACRGGHSPCPWCGRQLAVRKDGTPRVHSQCTARPDDAELLRLAAAEARETARYGVRGPMSRDAAALLDRLTSTPAGSS